MNHKDWQALIPFYVAKTLDDTQRQQFEAYVQQCGGTCHQEIEQWRQIALVVWHDADAIARSLPPLSQEVYNRLQYRDRPPSTQYSANPPRPVEAIIEPTRVSRLRGQRRFSIPVTLVAGLLMTFIFGGLLIVWSTRPPADNDAATIALNGTPAGEDGDFASSSLGTDPTPVDISEDVTGTVQSRDLGVLPTPFATQTVQSLIVTNTPFISPPTAVAPPPDVQPSDNGGAGEDNSNNEALSVAPETVDLNAGPYITPSPEMMQDGAPLCFVINPTDSVINVWQQANRDNPPIAAVLPSERYRTLVISAEGWYQIFLPNLASRVGWIAPETAILEGNCASNGLWLATPTIVFTPQPQPSATATWVVQPESGTAQVAVITNPAARLRSGPSNSGQFVTLNTEPLQVGDEFLFTGFTRYGNEQWIRIGSRDYPEAYLLLSDVQLVAAEIAQPTPTISNNP